MDTTNICSIHGCGDPGERYPTAEGGETTLCEGHYEKIRDYAESVAREREE